MNVGFKALTSTAIAPTYATYGDAGADLYADQHVLLHKNSGRAAVSTGIALQIPYGYVGLVHPRSGLAAKHGITVVNAPGTIDAGFRGEIKVLLINHGDEHIGFAPGDRIAQLVIQAVESVRFEEYAELSTSIRGTGGFGSTG